MSDWQVRRFSSAHGATELSLELGVPNVDECPRVGDIAQMGVEIPPVPGMRGYWQVVAVDFSIEEGAVPIANVQLAQATQAQVDGAANQRINKLVHRNWGTDPDWTKVWDRLEFLPPHRRGDAMREIQGAHRDRLQESERRARIEQLAAEQAERDREQLEAEQQQVEQRATEIRTKRAFEKFEGNKQRKIDLDED